MVLKSFPWQSNDANHSSSSLIMAWITVVNYVFSIMASYAYYFWTNNDKCWFLISYPFCLTAPWPTPRIYIEQPPGGNLWSALAWLIVMVYEKWPTNGFVSACSCGAGSKPGGLFAENKGCPFAKSCRKATLALVQLFSDVPRNGHNSERGSQNGWVITMFKHEFKHKSKHQFKHE